MTTDPAGPASGAALPFGASPVDLVPGGGAAQSDPFDGGSDRPPPPARVHRPGPQDWLLVAGLCLLTGWVAVVAVFFLPLHLGSIPLPISALLPVALLAWAPRAAFSVTGRIGAAASVVATWFGVSVFLVLARNDLYLQYPITVIAGQWRVMLLMGLGAITAAATMGLIWGDHLRRKLAPPPGTVAGAPPGSEPPDARAG